MQTKLTEVAPIVHPACFVALNFTPTYSDIVVYTKKVITYTFSDGNKFSTYNVNNHKLFYNAKITKLFDEFYNEKMKFVGLKFEEVSQTHMNMLSKKHDSLQYSHPLLESVLKSFRVKYESTTDNRDIELFINAIKREDVCYCNSHHNI